MEPTPQQAEVCSELVTAFDAFLEKVSAANDAGIDPMAVVGNHLRENMAEAFEQLPISLRMLI